jgi:HPt (histidine-containing phosphotransfer) domain-containing protein
MSDTTKLLDDETFGEIKSLLGDDLPMFLDIFFTENQQALENIKTGLSEENPDAIKAAAHGMKSSCAYLGAQELSNLAGYLEEHSQKDDIDDLKSVHYQAQGMFDIIRSELD